MKPKDPKTYLRANIGALMHPERATVDAVHRKVKGVGRGTIQRAMEEEPNPRLDSLYELAAAFRMEVWQLLVPGLKPGELPGLSGDAIKRWPFSDELLAAAGEADPKTLRRLENAARAALDMKPLEDDVAEAPSAKPPKAA